MNEGTTNTYSLRTLGYSSELTGEPSPWDPNRGPACLAQHLRLCLWAGWGAGRLPSRRVPLQRRDQQSGSPDPAGGRGGGLSHPGYRVTGQGGASWFVGRGMDRRPWDIPFGFRCRGLLPGSPGGQRQLPTGLRSRRPDPVQRGKRDAVSREVTGGAERTQGVRSPLCTPRGPGGSLCLRPPGGGGAYLGRAIPPATRSAPRAGAHLRCPPWPCPGRRAPLCCRCCSLPARPRRLRPERTLRAPRPAPPPRSLGRLHRNRRRLAAPSRSLKGAERRPRRPPSAPPGRD